MWRASLACGGNDGDQPGRWLGTESKDVSATGPSRTYRAVMACAWPIVAWWGRLEVVGLRRLPADGPVLLVANHDSHWDPVVVGVAALRRRHVGAIAKASMWRVPILRRVLDRMGQHPITRGRVDRGEFRRIVDALAAGECVGIFPEGGLSHGRKLRAYSGAGWFAKAVPGTTTVCVAISGSVDIARFPRRPQLRVEFFEPIDGQPRAGETSIGVSRRLLYEIRDRVPPVNNHRPERTNRTFRSS